MHFKRFLGVASCALAFFAVMAAPSQSQERLLTGYVADIGIEDLYNSSGTRLTSFAALIAQDRANFHRFGIRHPNDQSDAIFADRAMRAQIGPGVLQIGEYLAPYVRNVLSCQVNCGTYMYIQVFGSGRAITRINVQVPG